MAKNVPIFITSCIVLTLFVLLVYPAIIPINAPPILKTFKDVFVAVLSLVITFSVIVLLRARFFEPSPEIVESSSDACSLLCTLRC
jgi:hypothetical protein